MSLKSKKMIYDDSELANKFSEMTTKINLNSNFMTFEIMLFSNQMIMSDNETFMNWCHFFKMSMKYFGICNWYFNISKALHSTTSS